MTNEDLQQIQNLVTGASSVLVLTHKDPSVDTMASALAVYLAFSKMGKNVVVAMESQPLVEVSNLVGIDRVVTELAGGKDLLLTYRPYSLGDFERVSYLENPGDSGADSFKLTITPRDGYVPDAKNFSFSFTGGGAGNFDLLVTIDVLEPAFVGRLYDAQMFASVPIINIDNHDPNKDYGKFNLVEPDAASICEIVTFFLRAINAQIDVDIAGNLYQGIIQASNNFANPKVAAATFEAAAICLRAGAKQLARGQGLGTQPRSNTSPSEAVGPGQQPVRQEPTPQVVRPAGEQAAPARDRDVPQDWTVPKAYRGTSVV